jgi:transcriptional regulator with XRE-family HTH domain
MDLRQLVGKNVRLYRKRLDVSQEELAFRADLHRTYVSGVERGVAKHALTARHGPEIAETAELEEAIAVAESVIEIARDELRLEVGGIDPRKFDELAAPIEARHAAPWLRRRGAEVHVVDLEKRVERQPTAEELATGIFANTHDEYLKEQTTVPAVA